MSDSYPYIQTLHGFGESISNYAIQPISDDQTTTWPEENPIFAFGPLGYINIFVGATNAGKSRFLRTLAKENNYGFFLSIEVVQAFKILSEELAYLALAHDKIRFVVNYVATQHYGGVAKTHPGSSLPRWIREASEGLSRQSRFDFSADTQLFSRLQSVKEDFLINRLEEKSDPRSSINKFGLDDEYATLLMMRNLVRGEHLVEKEKIGLAQRNLYSSTPDQSITEHQSQEFAFDLSQSSQEFEEHFLRFVDALEMLCEQDRLSYTTPPQRIYIPTLRSAVTLSGPDGKRLEYDIFEETVKRNYQLEDTGLEIFTGNRLYDTLAHDIRSDWKLIDRLRDFEKFLGDAFYEGRRIELLALSKKLDAELIEHISFRVEGETPRELHHLGDGINTLIILLYRVFMAEPRSWIFIEEPELNLHPGLQRVFLQTLLENEALQERNLRVFFTTHSNHLLRMTLRDGTIAAKDISVFAFQQREQQKDRFLIRPLVSEHHDALALLGVQNASVLLAQCGVWVEGPTDRQYLRAFLNAYQGSKEFKDAKLRAMREDTHFAFWEYAGSNLAHYLMSGIPRKGTAAAQAYEGEQKDLLAQVQSSALCNRIFLLADRDGPQKQKQKHEPLRQLAQGRGNFVYHVTDGVEIENLLSPSEFKAVLPTFLKGWTGDGPDLDSKIYKNVGIGKFLRAQLPDCCPEEWAEASGTLATNRKNRLCELAVKQIRWETMSKEVKTLTKELHTFLARHNAI